MRRLALLATLLLCLLGAADAGATTLDRGFGDEGVVLTGFGPHVDVREQAASQIEVGSDGRIVLDMSGPRGTFSVERLDPSGALDRSFGEGGIITTAINGRAITPLGAVIAVGSRAKATRGRTSR
jgi:hypothetical protein